MMHHIYEAEFWVAVAFVVFLAILWKVGAFRAATGALDDRSSRIASELDQAAQLKAEAEATLKDAQRRHREAEREAQAIIEGARAEAERLAAEARTRAEEFLARRTRMAETKIAQAEQQAVADVRAAAAEAAVAAAEIVLAKTVKDKVADDLIGQGIKDVRNKLN